MKINPTPEPSTATEEARSLQRLVRPASLYEFVELQCRLAEKEFELIKLRMEQFPATAEGLRPFGRAAWRRWMANKEALELWPNSCASDTQCSLTGTGPDKTDTHVNQYEK